MKDKNSKIKELEEKHKEGYLKSPVKPGEFSAWEGEQQWGSWFSDLAIRQIIWKQEACIRPEGISSGKTGLRGASRKPFQFRLLSLIKSSGVMIDMPLNVLMPRRCLSPVTI